MWPFNRRKQATEAASTEVPSEIQEYYEAERREKAGIAWLVAGGTLLVTLIIAIGLFFGGRWAYRKIVNRNRPANVATTNTSKPEEATKPAEENKANQQASPAPQSNPSTPSSGSAPGAGSSTGSSSQQRPPSSPDTNSSQTAKGANAVPNTGPADNLAIFLVTTAIGTGFYEIRLHRRHNRS